MQSGATFSEMEVQVLNGEMTQLGKPENRHDWKVGCHILIDGLANQLFSLFIEWDIKTIE